MQYRRQVHCVYRAEYHLVLVTKYRRSIFKPKGMGGYLCLILKNVTKHYPDIEFLEAKTDEDHLHTLVSIPPRISVSDAVRIIKSNTARTMRKKFKWLNDVYYGIEGIWSDGYFVSTVGVDEDTIRRYIEHQGLEDAGQAKLEL